MILAVGTVASLYTTCVFAADTFPALSNVYAVIVLVPSAVIVILAVVVPAAVVVSATVCAPVTLYLTLFAPLCPSLPAVIFTVTFDL